MLSQRGKSKRGVTKRVTKQVAGSRNKTSARRNSRIQSIAKGKTRHVDGDSDFDANLGTDEESDHNKPRLQQDKDVEADDKEVLDWCSYVNTFDVCITTYTVLQHDLGVARPPPTRPRRANVRYSTVERVRSPLVMCEWYRVIMDEVQMVGGGKAEEMVSLVPRLSSFAVSGTPARAQVADLIHVVKFLRVGAIANSSRVWMRMLKPAYVTEFVYLFRRYAIRTMKAAVTNELTIPQQTRFLVPIELGRIERHVYDQNFENALLELGLDARGVAVREDWEVDASVLRAWLRKLRGICTHPQVGQLLNHANKLHKPGVLKTIGEVLEGMRDQNWRNLMEDRRRKIQTLNTIAQLQQQVEEDHTRYKYALDTLMVAENETQQLIADVKEAIVKHTEKGRMLQGGAAELEESQGEEVLKSGDVSEGKDKGKARARSEESPLTDIMELDDEHLPRNSAGEEHAVKRSALQHRLRECRITLHKVLFLKGNVLHVLGGAEDEAYAAADNLRRLLLKSTGDAAARAMSRLDHNATVKALKEGDLHIGVPYCGKGGIRSSDLMEEANEIIEYLLNEQSGLLWKWRERLITLLTQPLTSQDEDADGQEYARTLETQGEAEAYLQAYTALLADRREVLTAERTLLASHDIQETHARRTKAAQKAADAVMNQEELLQDDRLDNVDPLPEHEVLQKTLADERKGILETFPSNRAIKSVMIDLNNVAARIHKDDDPEKIPVKEAVARLRGLIADQSKLVDRLQVDLSHLRKAFNERILYFRQLQEISDTVTEITWEGDVRVAIASARADQTDLDAKINTGRARQRYLDHLAKSQKEGDVDQDDRCCVLCRCEFSRGYITQCAHVFCETCLKAWLGRREGKACPVCRMAINTDQLQRFAIEQKSDLPQQLPVRITDSGPVPKSRRQIQYNYIDRGLLDDIEAMESYGSYGSKIQTLVRHLLYLKIADPGAKSIIFSAWADSLHIIQHALNRNGIVYLRIDQNTGKENAAKTFRMDPNVSVLLLHGERENAGLNVTCASRVFLVESVVHHAFELQAIARIDRMGQTKPTEVYCYYAEETVERNILDLAARRGQSLYTKDNSAGTLDVSAFSMDADKNTVDSPAKKMQKGDFVFKSEDMLAILFPHLFEDVEYLLEPEDLGASTHEQALLRFAQGSINATPGPSKQG
ncbi:hypothetical protein AcV5_010081 [Taiwanofungus camphoratus]|nr:hypothetical protein AcV5_010081 [Antrodia cinnamomea]